MQHIAEDYRLPKGQESSAQIPEEYGFVCKQLRNVTAGSSPAVLPRLFEELAWPWWFLCLQEGIPCAPCVVTAGMKSALSGWRVGCLLPA